MIFDTIRLTNASGSKDLKMFNASLSDSLVVKEVDGLGPPEIDVVIIRSPHQGGFYQGGPPQNRQIVIRAGLNPAYASNQTPSDLRMQLYPYIIQNNDVPVTIALVSSGTVVLQTTGYISKFETVPFSKDPEIQITFNCISAFLRTPADVAVSLGALNKVTPQVTYNGTAPSGFHVEFTLTAAPNNITIANLSSGNQIRVPYWPFAVGDKITIDTRSGLRDFSIYRSGTGITTSLLDQLNIDEWLQIFNGVNNLSINMGNTVGSTTEFVSKNGQLTYNTFIFTEQHWGI